MNGLCSILVRPWHHLAGTISALVPFSLAEWLIGLGIGQVGDGGHVTVTGTADVEALKRAIIAEDYEILEG